MGGEGARVELEEEEEGRGLGQGKGKLDYSRCTLVPGHYTGWYKCGFFAVSLDWGSRHSTGTRLN